MKEQNQKEQNQNKGGQQKVEGARGPKVEGAKGARNAKDGNRDFYVALAQQKNSRVIECTCAETFALADLTRFADLGLKLLRNRLCVQYTPQQVLPLLGKMQRSISDLEKTVSEICAMAGVDKFRTPKTVEKVREMMKAEQALTDAEGHLDAETVQDPAQDAESKKVKPALKKAA